MSDMQKPGSVLLTNRTMRKQHSKAKNINAPKLESAIQDKVHEHRQKEEASNEYAVGVTEELAIKAALDASKLANDISDKISDLQRKQAQQQLEDELRDALQEKEKQSNKVNHSKKDEVKRRKPSDPKTPQTKESTSIKTKEYNNVSTTTQTNASKRAMEYGRNMVKREAQKKATESSKQAAKKSVEWSQKAGKAIVRTVKSVVRYIGSTFGIISIVVILLAIILIGIIMASPLGILFSNEPVPHAVPLSSAVAQINMELNRRLNSLQAGDFTSVEVTGLPPSWIEVVAVFASHTAGAEGGVDVASLTPDRVSRLKDVFWQMCYITSSTETVTIPDSDPNDEMDDSKTETNLTISIIRKTADEMRTAYGFTDYQNEALDTLLSPAVNLAQLISSVTIDDAAALELLESLPADLSPERRAVVQQALSLVGKVNYFWGGKSLVLGWDSRWGQLTKVFAAGSPTTGTYRPFGLDCSGFVDWVFYNVSGGSYVIGQGGGVVSQHRNCSQVSWGNVQPGDLVFYPDDSHIGIVGNKDATGHWLIIHCASGRNNVVITDSSGFMTAGRPNYYNE